MVTRQQRAPAPCAIGQRTNPFGLTAFLGKDRSSHFAGEPCPKTGKGNALSATSPETGRLPGAAAAAGPPPRRLGLALAVIATAQLMVVLDTTIVNNALPHIQDALHFSGSSLEWVVNGYTLAFGGLLLLGGRSGDLLGRRRIFIFGIALFSAASLLGGLATSQA